MVVHPAILPGGGVHRAVARRSAAGRTDGYGPFVTHSDARGRQGDVDYLVVDLTPLPASTATVTVRVR